MGERRDTSGSAGGGEIRTFVEKAPVDPARERFDELLAAHFSPAEVEGLRGMPARSLAGRVALKRAVLSALGDLDLSPQGACERDVELGRGTAGAPIVVLLPLPEEIEPEVRARLHVSISHTRKNAYGLVAVAGHARP